MLRKYQLTKNQVSYWLYRLFFWQNKQFVLQSKFLNPKCNIKHIQIMVFSTFYLKFYCRFESFHYLIFIIHYVKLFKEMRVCCPETAAVFSEFDLNSHVYIHLLPFYMSKPLFCLKLVLALDELLSATSMKTSASDASEMV